MTPAKTIANRAVTVVGGGRSGLAVARLLAGAGARVFLTERGAPAVGLETALAAAGVAFEFGGHTPRALDADVLVVSPGVPSTSNLVRQALSIGMPVYSEIEVASWFCRAPIVAITGSNGKTTTTSLLYHLFRREGRPTLVAGNIGLPFSDYVADASEDGVVVLEVSSFQLDHIATFRPRVAVLLNITPDHLDRYDNDFSAYAQSKFRIFMNQRDDDVLVYNLDDPIVRDYVALECRKRALNTRAFSLQREASAFVRDGALIFRCNQHEESLMQVENVALRGRHNLYNSLAAAVAARVMEVRNDVIRESLATFEGVPHRLEFVRELDGVRYVNDSKATNVNSVWYALESFEEPLVLIMGGRDKGNDYTALRPLVRRKVRVLLALGESADKVLAELGPEAAEAHRVHSMEEALYRARHTARPGEVVLLSPACASFDMFDNYEDRGDTFKRLVAGL